MKMWYAIEYAYGRGVQNVNGTRADHVHRFASKAARVRFLDAQERAGIDADAATATHFQVKRAIRYAAQGGEWPQAVMA